MTNFIDSQNPFVFKCEYIISLFFIQFAKKMYIVIMGNVINLTIHVNAMTILTNFLILKTLENV